MAKNTKQPAKERKCRKNIATLLSLMGFKDEDPAATVKMIHAKLREIQERTTKFKKPGHSTFKKPAVSTVKKITFKCGGKRATVSLKPLTPHSFDFTVIGDHDMEIADSRNNYDNVSESSSFDHVMNDDDCGGCMGLHSFIASMGGSEARLVIEKQLTSSDVNKGLGRLLIPRMNVKNSGFLTSNERRKLGNKQDISVPVFDLERRELRVNLARWSMNKEVYVLKTGWNNIVKANGLEQGMVIQVWAFRVKEEQLCFALVSV